MVYYFLMTEINWLKMGDVFIYSKLSLGIFFFEMNEF